MTEKSYGGNNGVREHAGKISKVKNITNAQTFGKKSIKEKNNYETEEHISLPKESSESKDKNINNKLDKEIEGYDDYIKSGEIAKEVVKFSKSFIKKDMLLVDIARKIEDKIHELGGELAFPVNLSIDDIAAHYHPTLEDGTKASGLLKVDIGIQIHGFIADTAFSLDLTDDKKYTKLIDASKDALSNALSLLLENPNLNLNQLGESIQKTIESKGFSPIVNLSGHGLGKYDIHYKITIPNYANQSIYILEPGAYAIEPFATTGAGKVYDGASSNIYAVVNLKTPRGPTARKILEYAQEKYKTLPFSLREIQEKFGPMARLGIKELEQLKILHNFSQLIEKSHMPVSQAEHTIIKTNDGRIIVTTR